MESQEHSSMHVLFSLVLTFIQLGLVFKFYCTVYEKVMYGTEKDKITNHMEFCKNQNTDYAACLKNVVNFLAS